MYDFVRIGREVGSWQQEKYEDELDVRRITVSSQRVTFELKGPTSMYGIKFEQTFSYDIYGEPPSVAIAEIQGMQYKGQPVTKIEINKDNVVFYGRQGQIGRLEGFDKADALQGFFAPGKFRDDLKRLYSPKQARSVPHTFPQADDLLWA